MASTTPNIGLTLPTGAEKVSRQIINDNNTKIDTAIGGTAGRELLGYKENGDTASQAIADGSFVVWKGSLCKANGNISQGATLSALNLTAVPSGGFNDLQGQVDSLSDSLASLSSVTQHYSTFATSSSALDLTLDANSTACFVVFGYCGSTQKPLAVAVDIVGGTPRESMLSSAASLSPSYNSTTKILTLRIPAYSGGRVFKIY